MLPAKVKLTKELACKLHDIRINTSVNNEILTAENLSKSIGNNRAWMSQIESRRLKNIKREDIIKIYKLLYNINSDDEAEEKAEMDLLKYLKPSSTNNLFFTYKSQIDDVNTTIDNSSSKQENIDKQTLKKIDKDFLRNCDEIKQNLIYYYHFLNEKERILANFYIRQLNNNISDGTSDTLRIAASLPLSNYQYASDEQKEIIDEIINNLDSELKKLDYTKLVTIYNDNANYYLEKLAQKNNNSVTEIDISNLFHLLADIFSKYGKDINTTDKITFINTYINIIHIFSKLNGECIYIDELTTDSNINVIKSTLDYIQIYVNGLNSHSYFMNKLSDIAF